MARLVQFDAYLQLPDRPALVALAASVLPDGTVSLSRTQISELAARAGGRLEVSRIGDGLRITLRVLPADWQAGSQAFAQLVTAPRFSPETVGNAVVTLPFQAQFYFQEALYPFKFDYRPLGSKPWEHLSAFWSSQQTAIAVTGPFLAGSAKSELSSHMIALKPREVKTDPLETPLRARRFPVSTIAYATVAAPPSIVHLAHMSVAAFMLGAGKTAALYQSVREEVGLSYRQEAFVWLGAQGVQIRAIIARNGPFDALVKEFGPKLVEQIKMWGESDLARAKLGLERALAGSWPVNPLAYTGLGEANDEGYQAAFSHVMFGDASGFKGLNSAIGRVKLEEVRALATELAQASAEVIVGG